jgi:hypothetical protein
MKENIRRKLQFLNERDEHIENEIARETMTYYRPFFMNASQ